MPKQETIEDIILRQAVVRGQELQDYYLAKYPDAKPYKFQLTLLNALLNYLNDDSPYSRILQVILNEALEGAINAELKELSNLTEQRGL